VDKIESDLGYVQIKLENINLIKNYNTILHIINPNEILKIINDLEDHINNSGLKENFTLQQHIKTIKTKIYTLIPHREKRGLFNFIGTLHKILYGIMDDDERQEIADHLQTIDTNNHNIIQNLNSQIKVNKNFNETFLKLKETIQKDRAVSSKIFNEIKENHKTLYIQTLYTDFLLKLKILQDNIEHIQDNISSSRSGIIHSNILTNEEILAYKIDFFKIQQVKVATVIDNRENIIFVIKVPNEILNLPKYLLIPISDKNFYESKFDQKYIIKLNNQTYDLNNNTDLKNIKLLNNCVSRNNCMKTFNNFSDIVIFQESMLILKNQNKANVTSDCDERKFCLLGNFLINFNNCSVRVNEQVFSNKQKEFKHNIFIDDSLNGSKNFLNNKELIYDDIILNHMNNVDQILENKFNKKHNKNFYINEIAICIIFILICIIICKIFCIKNILKVFKRFNMKPQESLQTNGGEVTSSSTDDFTNKITISKTPNSILKC